jgi:hypothetical protein
VGSHFLKKEKGLNQKKENILVLTEDHIANVFLLNYFSGKLLYFCLGLVFDMILLPEASPIVGTLGACSEARLIEMWSQ